MGLGRSVQHDGRYFDDQYASRNLGSTVHVNALLNRKSENADLRQRSVERKPLRSRSGCRSPGSAPFDETTCVALLWKCGSRTSGSGCASQHPEQTVGGNRSPSSKTWRQRLRDVTGHRGCWLSLELAYRLQRESRISAHRPRVYTLVWKQRDSWTLLVFSILTIFGHSRRRFIH